MAMASGLGSAQAVSMYVSRFNCFHNSNNKSFTTSSNRFDNNHCSRSCNIRFKTTTTTPLLKLRDVKDNNSRSSCRSSRNDAVVVSDGDSSSCCSCSDWDWNRWNQHFAEIEEAENLASVLKVQLKGAVENEDFGDAVKLKRAIAETMSKDSVAEIMSKIKSAVDEERYNDASILSRHTGSGLVGWWVGCSKESDNPFGRLVRITAGIGRFIGSSYTPRQLATSSPGTPLFEIYVVKETDGTFVMQAVCLQQGKNTTVNSSSTQLKSGTTSTSQDSNQESEADITENDQKSEKRKETSLDIDETTEEGIKSVINFLKDTIPELKVEVKVVNVDVTEIITDSNTIEQMIQEEDDDEDDDVSDADADENSESDSMTEVETIYVDEVVSDGVLIEAAGNASDEESDLDSKLFIGGGVHNTDDASSKDEYSRLPAEIKDKEKNAFVLYVPGIGQFQDDNETKISKVKVANIAAQGVSELMPPDIAKAFFSADKVSAKVSKEVRNIIKLAVSQAKKRNRLSETTTFSRITTPQNDRDPFDGLYIGAFGPYGTEVVQLRRKFGQWTADDKGTSNDLDFFEYVEAVKLTGDLTIPAGQVSFHAKIGKGRRNPNRGMYPDELGVIASYKGQGRIADHGFKNPKWVEGQLLQLNGKGLGPYVKGGADLGFLFSVPEQNFLVLFSRLKLPE